MVDISRFAHQIQLSAFFEAMGEEQEEINRELKVVEQGTILFPDVKQHQRIEAGYFIQHQPLEDFRRLAEENATGFVLNNTATQGRGNNFRIRDVPTPTISECRSVRNTP